MQKRGQITIVLVLVIFIVIALSIVIYLNALKSATNIDTSAQKAMATPLDAGPIKMYMDSVVAEVTKKSLEVIGRHGGYISLDPNVSFGESGFASHLEYQGDKVPCYTNDSNGDGLLTSDEMHLLPFQNITERLRRFVLVQIGNQTNFTIFEQRGYLITAPNISYAAISFNLSKANLSYSSHKVNLTVDVNEKSVFFMLIYPFLVSKREGSTELVDFQNTVNAPLKPIYDNISFMLKEIVNKQINPYNLGSFCLNYTAAKAIKVVSLDPHKQIITFIKNVSRDYNYTFRFALLNVSIVGDCPKIPP